MKNYEYNYKCKTRQYFILLFILASIFLTASCEKHATVDELKSEAKIFLDNKNYRASILKLKQAIQIDEADPVLRQNLGTTYLLVGNYPAAEKEFQKAYQSGGLNAQIIHGIAKSLLYQAKYKELFESDYLTSASDAKSRAYLLSTYGHAYLHTGRLAEAEKSFLGALELDPLEFDALNGMARLSLVQQDLQQARLYTEKAANISKDDPALLLTQARLSIQAGKPESAKDYYRRIIGDELQGFVTSEIFNAYIGLISLTLRDDSNEAEQLIAKLAKLIPEHPVAIYYQALLEYKNKRYDQAQSKLQIVIKKIPDHLPSYFLLGATNYALSNYEQANVSLTRFLNAVPTHMQARKLLAATKLKLNKPEDALASLKPVLDEQTDDTHLLMIAGRAAASAGNIEASSNYYERAKKHDSSNYLIREELAKIYLQTGRPDQAIEELSENIDNSDIRKYVSLARAYAQKGDYKEARAQLEAALAKEKSARIFTLLGVLDLQFGASDEAVNNLYKAVEIDNRYIPAIYYLARIESENGNLKSAEKYYSDILVIEPSNMMAHFGMAQTAEQQGSEKQAEEWLKSAMTKNPGQSFPYVILARYYLKKGRFNDAVMLAEKLNQDHADKNSALLLAQAYRYNRELDKSEKVFERLLLNEPEDKSVLIGYITLKIQQQDYDSALAKVQTLLTLNKQDVQALILGVRINLLRNDKQAALTWAEKINQVKPGSLLAKEVYGDVYASFNEKNKAIGYYQAALDIRESKEIYNKLATILIENNDHASAISLLQSATKTFPGDRILNIKLASAYQLKGDNKSAILIYKDLLEQDPSDPIILNNLAYIYLNNDLKQAIVYAERAYSSAPNNIAILDTLAWVLIKSGEFKRGMEYLENIVKRTQHPTIHYHYAYGLHKTGHNQQAREILNKIINSNQPFPELSEARNLLQRINVN